MFSSTSRSMNRSTRASSGAGVLQALAAALAYACAPASAAAAPALARPQYRLEATVEPDKPQVDGVATVAFTNTTALPLREAVFFLFPNRFSAIDPGINDFLRQYLYPEK